MTESTLLEVRNLKVAFGKKQKSVEVIHGVSFDVDRNSIVGIVGESGSGKSVTSLALMGLLPKKNAHFTGTIRFNGMDLLSMKAKEVRELRGKEIAMIFQEPMSALNPSQRCGYQVAEILQLHLKMSTSEARKETISLFEKVKLPRPREIYRSYPHQISGGQMQRVMIAMAIACKPKLLIADEPTTALDVTVQKEILQLLKELQTETGMSLLFISHDLSLVSEIANKVLVMYEGVIVEEGNTVDLFKRPKDPYTKALLASRPTLDKRLKRLPTIASLEDKSFKPTEISPQQRALNHKQIYTKPPLLEIVNLKKTYYSNPGLFQKKRAIKAVNDVSFKLYEGETLGLVGESGCGKSTLGKTILQLERGSTGKVLYRGLDLNVLSAGKIRDMRKEIQLIFQDPYSSLNPRMTIG
ncbi:MAG: ABC transporter ATP-binding protein, partial [Bacteroidia bacterium]|nr:ABC transporter ATP-binding protein [Bacteroidia bacterium]NNM23026.1 ABC transporter ATP-binding protein [Flavobacteriaceae bacterium]